MSAEEQIRRADQAKALLEHDLMREAFATIEAEILVQWDATSTTDSQSRERLWLMRQMLLRLRDHLRGLVEGGELTKKRLVEIDRDRKINLWRLAK